MFTFKKNQQIPKPEPHMEEAGSPLKAATARPGPVTYSQVVKIANAVIVWIKGRLDGVLAEDRRAHDGLARTQAEILTVLSEIKTSISPPGPPPRPPQEPAMPAPAEVAPLAGEPADEKPDRDTIKSLGMLVNQNDEFRRHVTNQVAACPQGCLAAQFAQETLTRLEGMRVDVISLLRTHTLS
jgi:hypothetical protein